MTLWHRRNKWILTAGPIFKNSFLSSSNKLERFWLLKYTHTHTDIGILNICPTQIFPAKMIIKSILISKKIINSTKLSRYYNNRTVLCPFFENPFVEHHLADATFGLHNHDPYELVNSWWEVECLFTFFLSTKCLSAKCFSTRRRGTLYNYDLEIF